MRRRDLLRGALGLGLLAALSPGAAASGSAEQQRAALSNAWRAALVAERPLLVIVIAEEMPWERGRAVGNWLNNASDTDLAPLGQVEVVCATVADLKRLVPTVGGDADPWFVLVDGQGQATGVHVDMPADPPLAESERYRAPDSWVDQKLDAQAAALSGALFPAIQSMVGPVPPARRALLGAQVRASLIEVAPAGAHWASSWGCGTTVEGVENTMRVGCGMGHVSPKAARFLYFSDVSEWD